MKKLFLIAVFAVLSSCRVAYAQTVEVSQEFVDDSAKAFTLVVQQRDAIAKLDAQVSALQKLTDELTRQKATPCSIAQEKLKLDLVFWFDRYKAEPEAQRQKQFEKILKRTANLGKKAIAAQCEFKLNNKFLDWLGAGADAAKILDVIF